MLEGLFHTGIHYVMLFVRICLFHSHFIVTDCSCFLPRLNIRGFHNWKVGLIFLKCIFAQGLLLEIRWVIWFKHINLLSVETQFSAA